MLLTKLKNMKPSKAFTTLAWTIIYTSVGCSSDLDIGINAGPCKGAECAGVLIDPNNDITIVESKQDLIVSQLDYSEDIQASIDGVGTQTFASNQGKLGLKIPEEMKPHKMTVVIETNQQTFRLDNVYMYKEGDFPLITADPATVCSSQQFYNESGVLVRGQKTCRIEDPNLFSENLRAGVSVGETTGSLLDCSAEGQTDCLSNSSYKVTDASTLASKVPQDEVVANISGEFALITRPVCSADGETNCESNTSFRAAGIAGLVNKVSNGQVVAGVTGMYIPDYPNVGNVLPSDTVNGISGTLALPAASDVISGISYGVGGNSLTGNLVVPTAAQVLSGITFGAPGNTVTGTVTAESHSNCTGANQTGCIATSNFRTIDLSARGSGGAVSLTSVNFNTRVRSPLTFEFWDENGNRHTSSGDTDLLASNIKSTVTVFGITGSLLESPGSCSTSGSQNCVADGSYYASTACSSNTQDSCYLTSAGSYEATDFTNIIAKNIKSGVTIAGVAGNFAIPAIADVKNSVTFGAAGTEFTGILNLPAASNVGNGVGFGAGGTEFTGTANIEAHSNCTAESQLGCVSHASFLAVDISSGINNKVLTGYSVAGVAGNVTIPAAGDTLSGTSYGHPSTPVTGTLTIPSASNVLAGTSNYGNPSSPTTPSLSPDFADVANVLNSDTVNGVTGTLTLPAAGDVLSSVSYGVGGNSLTGTMTSPAANTVRTGVSYGASGSPITGTAVAESHSDCNAANQTGCLSTATFLSIDLSNAGSGGAVSLNSTNFNSRVVSSSTFEYWDESGTRHTSTGDTDIIASNIRTAVDIFGVTGSVIESPSACSSNGSQSCVATGLYSAATACSSNGQDNCFLPTAGSFESTDFTNIIARNIRSGTTIAGISGNLALPATSVVQSSVGYGTSGSQFSGILTIPAVSNVGSGVGYGAAGTEFTGTADIESHTNCTSESQTGCLSHASFIAVDKSASSTTNKILSGQSVAGISGSVTIPATGNVLSGETYGVTSSVSTGALILPTASNVLSGSGTYGNPSSAITPSYSPDFPDAGNVLTTDTVNGSAGTLSSQGTWDLKNSFPGAGFYTGVSNAPTAGDIRRGVQVIGVTGNYPSSSSPLLRYVDSGATNNTSGSDETDLNVFATDARTAGTYEYWDSSGVRRTGSGDADISASNIRSGTNIHGITGSVVPRPSDCSTNGSQACVATSTYKAATACSSDGQDDCFVSSSGSFQSGDLSNLSSGNVKSGVNISGTTGAYPSNTYPLPSASGTQDLENATFNIRVKSSSSFEYWTSDGTRQTNTGSNNIQSSNIKSGVSIFGTTGNYTGP